MLSSYQLNRTYIATVLCTNLDNPELHCDGKCFMDIKLKELEQKKQHDQENLKRIVESVAATSSNLLPQLYEISTTVNIRPYLQQKAIGFSGTIFHPPKQA